MVTERSNRIIYIMKCKLTSATSVLGLFSLTLGFKAEVSYISIELGFFLGE